MVRNIFTDAGIFSVTAQHYCGKNSLKIIKIVLFNFNNYYDITILTYAYWDYTVANAILNDVRANKADDRGNLKSGMIFYQLNMEKI